MSGRIRIVTCSWLMVVLLPLFITPAVAQRREADSRTRPDVAPTEQESTSPSDDQLQAPQPATADTATTDTAAAVSDGRRQTLVASLTIFVLAIFVGFEVITKVPPTLHTPLMSGSNAISGITVVGALLIAGAGLGVGSFLGFVAVILATINVVGGFLVTHRMLAMFKKR
jgi:NAD(P) transhydrogenase subunit alpha